LTAGSFVKLFPEIDWQRVMLRSSMMSGKRHRHTALTLFASYFVNHQGAWGACDRRAGQSAQEV
jgi:hypothetical protein